MAIVNTVKTISAQAVPTEYVSLLAQALPASATTPFVLTGFVNYVRSGNIRVHSVGALGTSQITAIIITLTDGTTTTTIYQDAIARTASVFWEFLYKFITDLNATTITFSVTTGAGTTSTLDLEIAGNS